MGQFWRFLSDATLEEIHLSGMLFTWSNERIHSTLELIDQAFIIKESKEVYPNPDMCLLASSCSNHVSLILCTNNMAKHHKRFHFKAYWPKFSGFLDIIRCAWHCPLRDANPCRRLDWLLRNTTCVLKSWSDCCIGNIMTQLEVAKEVMHRLEMGRNRRSLEGHGESLRQQLKLMILGLSSLLRTVER
jgi:hypothetical protein